MTRVEMVVYVLTFCSQLVMARDVPGKVQKEGELVANVDQSAIPNSYYFPQT